MEVPKVAGPWRTLTFLLVALFLLVAPVVAWEAWDQNTAVLLVGFALYFFIILPGLFIVHYRTARTEKRTSS